MKFIFLLIFLITFNINCSTYTETQSVSETTRDFTANKIENNANESKVNINKDKIENNEQKATSIKNTIGLITLNDKYPSFNEKKDKNDFIRFYNEDGSLWYEFTFYYDDSDEKFEYKNDNFRAFSFHPDYSLISLRCVEEDKNRYEVVVNEEIGLKKYVKKNDENLKLESWENHILKTFSIDIKKAENKVFETPDGKELKPDFEQIDRFEAVEIKDDWLKVKWEIPNKKEEFESGWVRWKKDDIILIDWFYIA